MTAPGHEDMDIEALSLPYLSFEDKVGMPVLVATKLATSDDQDSSMWTSSW